MPGLGTFTILWQFPKRAGFFRDFQTLVLPGQRHPPLMSRCCVLSVKVCLPCLQVQSLPSMGPLQVRVCLEGS